ARRARAATLGGCAGALRALRIRTRPTARDGGRRRLERVLDRAGAVEARQERSSARARRVLGGRVRLAGRRRDAQARPAAVGGQRRALPPAARAALVRAVPRAAP